jgi:hypothetical protein
LNETFIGDFSFEKSDLKGVMFCRVQDRIFHAGVVTGKRTPMNPDEKIASSPRALIGFADLFTGSVASLSRSARLSSR